IVPITAFFVEGITVAANHGIFLELFW
ncbi:unnamed protein product, partial [Allacma fusca]